MSQTGEINAKSQNSLTLPMGEADGIDFVTIELLFFAYRDFISDPDAMLERSGFGRAHHRVIHFVNREPGLTVAALLEILQITKQSLARVLKQLIDSGYINQVAGLDDRRQRHLYPTQKGREFALNLARPQSRRITQALKNLTENEKIAVKTFLSGMINPAPPIQTPSPDTSKKPD